MKTFLLICVNYKSYEFLQVFLESVARAAEKVKGRLKVDIEVADNSENNLGYLGGALPIYSKRAKGYDYVSISNVDLQLTNDFFEKLLCIQESNIGWIAPDIYTDKINRHENPYLLKRPDKHNFFIWNIIYSSTFLYRLYRYLYILKSQKTKIYPQCTIYAGHGSFMLFTKEFIDSYPKLQFPGFMYGEEIFFAELVRRAQKKVLYAPTLKIENIGNISTGLLNQKQKSKWSKESLNNIYKQFFVKK